MLKIPTVLVGVSGEYFVAAELSRRGYIASISLRNTRGLDILATNQEATRSITIQVKTSQVAHNTWILSEKSEHFVSRNHFYVFVGLAGIEERPIYHIVPSQVVAKHIRTGHRAWLKTFRRDGKKHAEALPHYDAILKRNPKDLWVSRQKAEALAALKRLPEGERVLMAAMKADPQNDESHFQSAEFLTDRERWADANAVFSVNLSGKSVVRPDFRHYLESCLDKSRLPLTALRFEVAELDAGVAPEEFAALARMLIDRGCEVSVDNVGTGSGHFEFLRDVNADLLKIDGSIIHGASDDILSRAIINGLVHMADTLGMRTVASQVDSTGQLRAVTQLGVDYVQGYRVRRPKHIDDFEFLSCGVQFASLGGACA